MPTLDEQEHLVQEFCKNTSASERLAREVLNRNGWVLSTSYKEVEQMCVSGNRSSAASMHPPYRHPYKEPIRPQVFAMASRGGTEGGIGPAVSLDLRGIRPPARYSFGDNIPQSHPMQGLKVALPPVTASVERIIPIHVEGGRTVIPAQTSAQGSSKWANPPSVAMARVTLNEKVLPSQPSMVAPTTVANTNVSNNDRDQASSEFSSAVDSRQLDQSSSNSLYNLSESCYPRLKRGFSNIIENESIVIAARTSVLHDIKEDNHQQMFSTFMLPDITIYTEEFTQFLNKELIESSTLNSLQMAGRLNWWADQGLCQRLIPMATTGDGNCLLHAASLAMWGIHDRQLTLRNALHHTLTKASYKDYLCRRWRWQQTLVNQQSGLVFSEAEWKAEWENILRLASPSPRSGPDHFTTNINSCCDSPVTHSSVGQSDPVVYESLEEFHVFVLAHVLKRPIIVVADTILRDANGDALAPIPFGGIYLPLECISKECCLSPLLLTYDAAHFSALVPMQNNSPDSVPWAIPVMDPQLQLLPLHFWHDPGPQFDWSTLNNKTTSMLELCQEDRLNLLKQYMDIIQLPFCPDSQLLLNNNPLTGRQPSSGSEEGTSLNCGTVKKDKKEGKGNSVAKQFGSLGKSVGKKLKNLGNNLAPGKPGKSSVEGEKGGGSLSGGLSQSAKVITAVATTGSGEKDDWVYCAKLMLDHLPEADFGRQQFINNYLKDAQRRFQEQEQKRQQKAEELRAQLPAAPPPYSSISQSRFCRTPECQNCALPDLSLCDRCANQQSWGTLDRSVSRGGGYVQQQNLGYNTFPGRHKAPTGLPQGPTNSGTCDEIYKCGKSKFYTPPLNEPVSLLSCTPLPNNLLQTLRENDRQTSLSVGNVARPALFPRPRSPSPDYDNLRYAEDANRKCAMPGCDFYGSKQSGGLCSSCYKSSPYPPQLAQPEKTTRL